MPNTRKEDTTPATKADIGLVLQKLGTVADDVCGLKKDVTTLKTDVGTLQNAFAKHEKTMLAQFMLVFEHIDRSSKEMREHFDEKFELFDRRLRVVERRTGVPS